MNLTQNTYINISVKIASLCAVIVMVALGVSVYQADIIGILIFAFFAIFYVQIPGLFILGLFNIRYNHMSSHIVASFFSGWAFVVAQYFISELINTDIILYFAGPACSVAYIILLSFKKKGKKNCSGFHISVKKTSTSFCVFVVLVLLYALVETQYIYMAPDQSDSIFMSADMSYHMGLIDSLSHGFPLVSLWVQGRVIKYHIFTEILYSVPVRIFGISADTILMSCSPYLTTWLIGLSFYSFYKTFITKKQYAGLCCLITVLANMYITKSLYSSWYFYHVFSNINNFGFGICACMVAIVTAKHYSDATRNGWQSIGFLVLLVVFTMLTTGIKGPVSLVLVGGVWGTLILGLILRKVSLRSTLPVLLVTAGFLLIYITILGMKGQSNGSGTSFIAFATVADIAFFKGPLVALLKSLGLPKIFRLGAVFVVFMIFLLTAFILPFTVGYIRELILVISGRKDFDFIKVMIYASCLVGLIAMFILNYSGHSQVYFGFVTIAFAPLVSFWFFEDIEKNKGLAAKLIRIIFIICLAATTFILVTYYKDHISRAVDYSDATMQHDYYMSMSNDEYDAMVWLAENSPEDSLLATDRYYSVPLNEYDYEDRWDNRFFLYANYSNRFCYIAGSGYNLPGGDWVIRKKMIQTNDKLYETDYSKRGKLANKLGIDYVVVSKRFTRITSLENADYKLCYSNKDIDIYEVK